MNNVLHAHKLMDFIQNNSNLSSIGEIKVAFEKKHGDVKFTNCTKQIYTFEEIIYFLQQRDKIQLNTNGVKVIQEHRCDHE